MTHPLPVLPRPSDGVRCRRTSASVGFIAPSSIEAVLAVLLLHAFDLARDAGERNDLGADEQSRAVLAASVEFLRAALHLQVAPTAARLDAATLEDLMDLGYGED